MIIWIVGIAAYAACIAYLLVMDNDQFGQPRERIL